MAVTIINVAEKAGVSPSTVSRVISNDSRISQKTSRKVRKVMEELGYHPNLMAKSLVTRTTHNIGIVLPRPAEELFQNQFFSEIIRGIVTKAASSGYDILMTTSTNEIEEWKAVERLVQGRNVDGIILLASQREDPNISFLREKKFPFVLVGRSEDYSDITSVDNDNIAAAQAITRHLIELGHRRIGFVSGPFELTVSKDRLDGYSKALLDGGIPFRGDYVFEGAFTPDSAMQVTEQILKLEERPTAIIAIDDVVAFGIIRSLWNNGLRVPEDCSVVGFNNTSLAEMCLPQISSVDIGMYQMGQSTVQALIQRIKGDGFEQARIIIPHQLIWRRSVTSPDSEA
ncbi:LacI family DNA-binding transcriptional regulator [Paenibacillus sp. OSY-SE]|uniref:LacI family DNA-binding transcriptional regulator n=1 Tax=Paenibacillus sp. OSY-SE TaxID=1196323 RepID=UPI0002D86A60|nr:LacI family DNA-binding transcriptional regulator [Paenibacillus sp. OSY-SE]